MCQGGSRHATDASRARFYNNFGPIQGPGSHCGRFAKILSGTAAGRSERTRPGASAATIPRMSDSRDRDLGMHRPISRRDFIGGVAVGIGGATWAAGCGPGQPPLPPDPGFERVAGYYPPAKSGLRGSHDGSLRGRPPPEGRPPRPLEGAADTGESYDLVVVGGGISGLAAAHYFRAAGRRLGAGPGARQPRRLRRPRQAQRVHATAAAPTSATAAPSRSTARRPYSRDRQGAHHRPRHRRRAATTQVLDGELYALARPLGRHLLRQGDLRRRQARGRHVGATRRRSSWPSRRCRRRRSRRQILRLNDREARLPARACRRRRRRPGSRA